MSTVHRGASFRRALFRLTFRVQPRIMISAIPPWTNGPTAVKPADAAIAEGGSSASRMRTLFLAMEAGVVYLDASAAIVDANPAAERLLGLTRDELLRRTSEDARWGAVHEDGTPFPDEQHPAMVALRTGRPVRDVTMGVLDGHSREERWLQISATPLFGAGPEQPSLVFAIFTDISARVRAERDLASAERRTQAILDSVAAQLAVLDASGRIAAVNERWRRYALEAGSPEFMRLGADYVAACRHELAESGPEIADGLERVLSGAEPAYRCVYPWHSPLERRWFALTATPLSTPEAGLVLAHEDVSAHWQAEEMLATEARVLGMVAAGQPLQETLVALLLGIEAQAPGLLASVLLLDRDGRTLRHGAAPSLPESYSRAVDGLVIGEGRGSCGTAAWRRQQVVVEDTSTDPLWADFAELAAAHGLRACWSAPIFDALGVEVLGTFALYYRRAVRPSEHHQRLIALATHLAAIAIGRSREERALRESETRFQDIVEASADWVWEIDSEERYTFASGSVKEVLGYAPAEILGRSPFDLMPPEEAARVGAAFRSLARAREPFRDLDNVNLRKDGTLRHIQSTGKAILDGEGRLLGYRGIDRDVTSKVEALRARERLQAELAQAQRLESLGRLAGGVAHDFNNMLSVIVGRAEMAELRLGDETRLRRDLAEIRAAARRSADLVGQLLAFARRQPASPKVVDLNETVAGMLKMLRRLIGEEIELQFLPGARLWPVLIDPSQADQVLTNLTVNARDAIGGPGRVEIRTGNTRLGTEVQARKPGLAPGDYVTLEVADNGAGMDAATLERIFEPFFSTKAGGRGTGLGLATVYGVVQQNGGRIEVDSRAGSGSTFRILLPRTEARREGEAVPLPAPSGGHETILVVEDEAALLEVVSEVLLQAGYTVLAATSPAQALDLARGHAASIDLLMTDVVMPGMNGRDLAASLDRLRPGIRCLYASGYTADIVTQRGVAGEGARLLQKPCSGEELLRHVRAALDA